LASSALRGVSTILKCLSDAEKILRECVGCKKLYWGVKRHEGYCNPCFLLIDDAARDEYLKWLVDDATCRLETLQTFLGGVDVATVDKMLQVISHEALLWGQKARQGYVGKAGWIAEAMEQNLLTLRDKIFMVVYGPELRPMRMEQMGLGGNEKEEGIPPKKES